MGWRWVHRLVGAAAISVACATASIAAAATGDVAGGGSTAAAAQLIRAKSPRSTGAIVLTVVVHEAGQLSAVGLFGPGAPRAGASRLGTARRPAKVFGSAQVNLAAPTTIALKLRPTAAARRTLRRRHRLRVYVTVVLLPTHGSSATLTMRAVARLRAHRRS